MIALSGRDQATKQAIQGSSISALTSIPTFGENYGMSFLGRPFGQVLSISLLLPNVNEALQKLTLSSQRD